MDQWRRLPLVGIRRGMLARHPQPVCVSWPFVPSRRLGAGGLLNVPASQEPVSPGRSPGPEPSPPQALRVSGELLATVDHASMLLRAGRPSPAQPPRRGVSGCPSGPWRPTAAALAAHQGPRPEMVCPNARLFHCGFRAWGWPRPSGRFQNGAAALEGSQRIPPGTGPPSRPDAGGAGVRAWPSPTWRMGSLVRGA